MRRLLCCALLYAATQCSLAAAAEVSLHGSTTVNATLIVPLRAEIERLSGQQLAIIANGSQRGIADLVGGSAQIAMISAPLDEEVRRLNRQRPGAIDAARLRAYEIGETRVAFAVHPSNPVRSVSGAQLADIFAGRIRYWSDLRGYDRDIVIVAAQPGDGLRSMVEMLLLQGGSLPADARSMTNATQVASVVAQLPGAIGIVAPTSLGPSVAELRGATVLRQPLLLVTLIPESAAVRSVVDAAAKLAAAR
jgi:phosphate transport system substrate-binding protein